MWAIRAQNFFGTFAKNEKKNGEKMKPKKNIGTHQDTKNKQTGKSALAKMERFGNIRRIPRSSRGHF
jgi:hypothetical protein